MLGIVSACSLPLGSLSAHFWRPGDRTMAFLMAFGGGSLLAALTIDLVASTVAKGFFAPLGIGCILGGLLFVLLNEIVNDYGGFVRKASTTFFHLNRPNFNRTLRIFSRIKKVEELRDLPRGDYRALSFSMSFRTYHKDSMIQRTGDPTDELYIIASGEVELGQSEDDDEVSDRLGENDVFNWMDFVTGSPATTSAKAITEVCVWVIPRGAFFALLPNSSLLLQKVHMALRDDAMLDYLMHRHHLSRTEAEDWVDQSVKTLLQRGGFSDAVVLDRKDDEFIEIIEDIKRYPLFHDLPQDEIEELANHLVYKKHAAGTTLYHKGYRADRMYFVASGEVSLVDPAMSSRARESMCANTAFGGMAFFTGSYHTTSAITRSDIEVWVLRKQDLEEVLPDMPVFAARLEQYLTSESVIHYLERKQAYDIDRIKRWTLKLATAIKSHTRLPNISELGFELNVSQHKGAPMAIWLGILLDGIPESLVIGASFVHSHISFSLIGGLFLSNFPEALSSSVSMRQQGFRFRRILWMWTSLMLFTGIGAVLGNFYFTEAEPSLFALVQGVAAGAMLTMIAQTMLPEAYFKGGSIIGFSTLLGFLTAIFLKTLE